MFYSQFILAKKGPLGTIWIAAHLERKLRKNQVADTDIGVSVDSILFPDVPIALRLSSHLLLGVVRIYSRKVNYLFDDCSEALLKVKQAFRSAAVDLPPEESKAPYHSITLPETFDLDDFELPDNDIFQGNYVDHHVSSRDQITLQDTMDGTSYSTSKFGLDERFGDGDASVLDIDEELFLDKIGTSGLAEESGDPQASVQPMTPLKLDEHPQERTNSETMVDLVGDADVMDYAQAPCTPGLAEEPNLANVKEASACDDHLEVEDHLVESTIKESDKNVTSESKQEADSLSRDFVNSNTDPWRPTDEIGYRSGGLEIEQLKAQGESPCIEAKLDRVKLDNPSSVSGPSSDLSNQVEVVNSASELVEKITELSVAPTREDLQNDISNQVEAVTPAPELVDKITEEASVTPAGEDLENHVLNNEKRTISSANETNNDPRGSGEISLEYGAQNISDLSSTYQQVSEVATVTDQASVGVEDPVSLVNVGDLDKSCIDASEISTKNQGGCSGNPETRAYQDEPEHSNLLNSDVHENMTSTGTQFLRPCSSKPEQSDIPTKGCDPSLNPDLQSDTAALGSLEISGREETVTLGGECHVTDDSEQFLKENHVEERARREDAQAAFSKVHGEVDHIHSEDRPVDDNVNNSAKSGQILKENHVEERASGDDAQAAFSKVRGEVDHIHSEDGPVDENLNNSVEPDLPAPEKLLSITADRADIPTDILEEDTPMDFVRLDEDNAGSKMYSGNKRSLTESTLTEIGANSVESSRMVRAKRTAESVPDDDDLLSSILVGRRSSSLKVKPTPVHEVTSVKRARPAPRTGTAKRKVLIDDTMVLHGDMIRQQLMNTEDLRRVRKKAPCTRPEISMIQKQHLEDEIFLEPIFAGLSIELASLLGQEYDLSRIRICQDDRHGASLDTEAEPDVHNRENNALVEDAAEPRLASQSDENGMNNDKNEDEGSDRPNVSEQIEMGANGGLLADGDNELAGHGEIMENKSMVETSHAPSAEVSLSQEQVCPTNDGVEHTNDHVEPDIILQQGLSQNVTEVETSDKYADAVNPDVEGVVPSSIIDYTSGDGDDAPAGILQKASLNEISGTDSTANVDEPANLPDQKIDAPFVELDFPTMNPSNENAMDTDEVTDKNGDITEERETEPNTLFSVAPEVDEHGATVELIPDTNHGELEFSVQSETDNGPSGEQKMDDGLAEERPTVASHPAESSVPMEDVYMNDDEYPNQKEDYQPSMTYPEISGFDLQDRDGFDNAAPVNDTEFLNVDDEDVSEMADDYMPDAEETHLTENSGWSSRTRAVSKYLQTMFEKEAECGRRSLSMDNVLTGKTRKEASRMFFEALVLKTRDYIHVEQRSPAGDVTIKPRVKLMKSNF